MFCVLTTTKSKAKIWRQYNVFRPLVAKAAVCSKEVVPFLLIN